MTIQWFDKKNLDREIEKRVQTVNVVLDIGCGIRPQTFFQPELHIFCEPYSEYLKKLQIRFAGHSNVVFLEGTAQEIIKMIPDQSVDTIFLMDVIEHLEKPEGERLISECERVARRQILIFTPLGFMPQEFGKEEKDAWGFGGGCWQAHRSGWTPEDFGSQWEIIASKNYHKTDARGRSLDSPFGAFWAIKERKLPSLPVKLGVLSHILPPSPSGQAIVLYRLLGELKPEDYCLLSSENYDPYTCKQNSGSRLPAKYFKLPMEFSFKPILFGLRLVCNIVNSIFHLFQRAKNIARIVKQERCGAVVACSGDPINLPAGYLAGLLARVPFYAYIFDDYIYQWTQRKHKWWARCLEPIIIKGAMGVIVPNEFLKDEYRRRYQIESTVVHNPCEISEQSGEDNIPWPVEDSKIKIVYTGALYQAHYDAFRNLISAIEKSNQSNLRLHLYTAQAFEILEKEGITGPVIYNNHIPHSRILDVQRSADILFLPLAFHSPFPEVIKTSAPGKMGEYLASGRPILVHAPPDSFVSDYFRENKCGFVVNKGDPEELIKAIQTIIENVRIRDEVVKNALDRAKVDFSLECSRDKFFKLFQEGKKLG